MSLYVVLAAGLIFMILVGGTVALYRLGSIDQHLDSLHFLASVELSEQDALKIRLINELKANGIAVDLTNLVVFDPQNFLVRCDEVYVLPQRSDGKIFDLLTWQWVDAR